MYHYAGYPLHTENRENGKKKIPVRENTGNVKILSKHRGIWFAQVVNILILKVKDIAIFAANISIFGGELDKSVLYM